MKYNNGYDKNQGDCLPPEAYIRLMQSSKLMTEGQLPRFRSTVYPTLNLFNSTHTTKKKK
jgi:hypothetical protein